MSVDDVFKQAMETFKGRGEQHGHTWYQVGEITKILYPNGISLQSKSDFSKFHILQWLIGKLVRFANTPKNKLVFSEHMLDAGVYCFILESIIKDETSNHIPDEQA